MKNIVVMHVNYNNTVYPDKRCFASVEAGKTALDAVVKAGQIERATLYEYEESLWGEMLPGRILYNFEPEFYGDEEIHDCVAEEADAVENGYDVWGEDEADEEEGGLEPDDDDLYTEEEIDALCKEAETEAALHGPWDDESMPRHEALKLWVGAVRAKIEAGEIDVDEVYLPARFWEDAAYVRVLPVVDDVMFVPHVVAFTICWHDPSGEVYDWEDVKFDEPLYVERLDDRDEVWADEQ